jgi:transcription-repair coupling factor (superfamily II helicase)
LAQDFAAVAASQLFAQVSQTPAVQSLVRQVERGGALTGAGVTAGAQPFLAALLHRADPERPLVIVTADLKLQETFHQDLTTWLGVSSKVPDSDSPATRPQVTPFFYPAWEVLPHESKLPHADVISERLETLVALSASPDAVSPTSRPVIAAVTALLQRTFAPANLRGRIRTLNRGERIEPLDLVEWLEAQGYEPEAQVTQKGELALRGGILDIYPLTSPWPVRLEFFGDELESLRHFDPQSQISRDEIASITIPPAGELGLLKQAQGSDSAPSSAGPVDSLLDYLPERALIVLCDAERLAERAREYAQQASLNDPFSADWDKLLSRCRNRGMTILELTDADFTLDGLADNSSPSLLESGNELTSPDLADNPSPRRTGRGWPRGRVRGLPDGDRRPHDPALALQPVPLHFTSLEVYRPLTERPPEPQVAEVQRREFFHQLHRWLRQDYTVQVFCNNDGERQRLTEIWAEHNQPLEPVPTSSDLPPSPRQGLKIDIGTLSRGFLCDDARVVVVTDAEIFGRYKVQRPRRLKSAHAQAARSALDIDFTELEEGDYVVHLQHGIGRYAGLRVLPAGAGARTTEPAAPSGGTECLVIEYAPADPSQPPPRLYVPVTEAHLVGKYVGAGKARPPLNTLGGTRWHKTREQAERAVRDVAGDLLAIQAARESQSGHACGPDVSWQREFEGSFIFEETPDQLRAIQETKADMERPKPMDRLICGDVGFGKTEVAIRAAFKAVMDGKQAAVLVPTTVLAQQHFNTFRERMADYPVRVDLLSRFRTRREQQRTVRDLAAGAVDIVVGTHRLLQADIAFKDLGLVVIDEEQRFGVMHKEKFKLLRKLVDVLTLSATPIPRTLYLALAGARDMSTIQTPPHDRLPVETIVTAYDERILRDAIQRELNRGGQVFFLHNRVATIDTMRQRVQTLVPHARVIVGHGQMHSDELEEVMTQFVNGEADVLLSTTIIESGLDIPNANTIIIDRADRFGLSDLYQLRGRVGRYKHQAYAYLLLPRHAGVLADARKRISAIKQYSTLGSGFKIAMRDLEIRGAGNLLGQEQSGHITAVGFELYCQLLKRSVAALKGEKIKPRVETILRLDFLTLDPADNNPESAAVTNPKPKGQGSKPGVAAAFVPFNYVSDARQRIEIYRKVAQAADKPGLEALKTELRDRFGPPPPAVNLLLQVAELKLLAGERGVTEMEVKEDRLMLTRNNDFVMVGGKFPRLMRKEATARLNEIKKLLLAISELPRVDAVAVP